MIPQRNLSLLSNRLAKQGGRRIPETILERDYCLSWFLVGLSKSPLRERLAFKGGTALKKCYFSNYRFSEDLDFTILFETSWAEIEGELNSIFDEIRQASGIEMALDHMDKRSHENSHTFYLSYEGPLPKARGKTVKVDITIREHLALPIEKRPVIREYNEYMDLPENAIITVYSLEEVVVEKTVALLDKARNEPRDLYDIWYITSNGYADLEHLLEPLSQKLDFRGVILEEVTSVLSSKEARYKKLWNARLAAQMSKLPEFDTVYRAVRRAFRQAGISGD